MQQSKSKDSLKKAKNLLGEVKLVSSVKGRMEFGISGIAVYKDKGTWSCNNGPCALYLTSKKECCHIMACEKWLRGEDL